MGKKNKEMGGARRHFLLSFFEKDEKVREVNGFMLHKYFDNNIHEWSVGVYTKDSWEKRQQYLEGNIGMWERINQMQQK